MKDRKYLRNLGIALVLCLFVSILWYTMGPKEDFLYKWNRVFGGAYVNHKTSIMTLLQILLPVLLFPYLFADFFGDEFHARLPYIFIRTARRTAWLFKKTLQLFGYAALYAFAFAFVFFIVMAVFGAEMNLQAFTGAQAVMLLLFILQIFFLAFTVNMFAIKIDPAKIALVVLGIHISCALLYVTVFSRHAKEAAFFLPVCQFFYAWHQAPGQEAMGAILPVPYFTLLYSAGYLLVLLLAGFYAAARAIRKVDIL